jgi:hypothetical protein
MGAPKRAVDRITSGLKKYQTILAEAKSRDVNESDTVLLVRDILTDLLGYKKLLEITSELPVKTTFVDLATKVDDKYRFLIEVKSIGMDLKDSHVRQAVDYGANQGSDWIVLTNGIMWRLYKVYFQKPIDKYLVFAVDLGTITAKDDEKIECLATLSREGFTESSMSAFFEQKQATGRFALAALILTDSVLAAAKRELPQLYPSVRVEVGALREMIKDHVLKHEVVDSDEAQLAQDAFKKKQKAFARKMEKDQKEPNVDQPAAEPT